MESNKETPTTSSNQTSPPNLNPDSNPTNSNNSNLVNDNLKFIDYSRFDKINVSSNEIGDEIFKAYWKDTNSHVSLKKIQSQNLEQVKSHHKLSHHRNILTIFGYSQKPDSEDYFLVTEYANGGNLREYLKENYKKLSWHDKMKLAVDITSGLQCMHSHGILHLTLHPCNIFVHNNKLSIGDLGLSRSVTEASIINIKILPYTEPNFIASTSYPRDKKSDIYSLGLILHELSSGKAPFASVRFSFELSKKILSGERGKPVVGTPIEYIDLYEQCWDNDPSVRPSAEDVLTRLSRMNLSPVYEDTEIKVSKTTVEKREKKNVNEKSNDIEVVSETSTQYRLDSVVLDFGGGIDSGFGGESRERPKPRTKKEKKCQLLPCFPKCRFTFGVFLCWMCVILLIAIIFLAVFFTRIIKAKAN